MLIQCGDVYRRLKDVDILAPSWLRMSSVGSFDLPFLPFFESGLEMQPLINPGALLLVFIVAFVVVAFMYLRRRLNSEKPYKVFLTHHKGAAGSLARFIKLILSKHLNWNNMKQLDQWTAICGLIKVNEGQDERFVWSLPLTEKAPHCAL